MPKKLCPLLNRSCEPACMFFMEETEDCLIRKSLEEVNTHKTLSRIQTLLEVIKREI